MIDKVNMTYKEILFKYGFSNNQQLECFLFRIVLGFHLDENKLPMGPLPLVPDIVTNCFVKLCQENAEDLNCISTHQAYQFFEDVLGEREIRAYILSHEIRCPTIAQMVIERFENFMISSSWFNNYCSENNLQLVNGQSLEESRRKYCHENVMKTFYSFLKETIHQNPFLLYNMEETSCIVDAKGKLVVPVNLLTYFYY